MNKSNLKNCAFIQTSPTLVLDVSNSIVKRWGGECYGYASFGYLVYFPPKCNGNDFDWKNLSKDDKDFFVDLNKNKAAKMR